MEAIEKCSNEFSKVDQKSDVEILLEKIEQLEQLIDIDKMKKIIFDGANLHATILKFEDRMKKLEERSRKYEDLVYEKIKALEEKQKFLESNWIKIERLEKEIERIEKFLSSDISKNIREKIDSSNFDERITDLELKINMIRDQYSKDWQTAREWINKEVNTLFSELTAKDIKSELVAKDIKRPYKCPVCGGSGEFEFTSLEESVRHGGKRTRGCNACQGKGIVWG